MLEDARFADILCTEFETVGLIGADHADVAGACPEASPCLDDLAGQCGRGRKRRMDNGCRYRLDRGRKALELGRLRRAPAVRRRGTRCTRIP